MATKKKAKKKATKKKAKKKATKKKVQINHSFRNGLR
jgi:hypothetical protein